MVQNEANFTNDITFMRYDIYANDIYANLQIRINIIAHKYHIIRYEALTKMKTVLMLLQLPLAGNAQRG